MRKLSFCLLPVAVAMRCASDLQKSSFKFLKRMACLLCPRPSDGWQIQNIFPNAQVLVKSRCKSNLLCILYVSIVLFLHVCVYTGVCIFSFEFKKGNALVLVPATHCWIVLAGGNFLRCCCVFEEKWFNQKCSRYAQNYRNSHRYLEGTAQWLQNLVCCPLKEVQHP